MKLDPGMHIGLHLVFFGKSGVTRCMLHAGRLLRWKTNRRQCMNASTIDRCWRIDLDAAVSPPTLRACLDGGL
jgi:hypothetical protein